MPNGRDVNQVAAQVRAAVATVAWADNVLDVSVSPSQQRRFTVAIPATDNNKASSAEVTIAVPPHVCLRLKSVDQDLSIKLAAILGHDYEATWRVYALAGGVRWHAPS